MNRRIIFMTEEESMGMTLRELFPNLWPDFLEKEDWLIIDHSGKNDLERSFPKKMRAWRDPNVRFVILRDNDGSDCRGLKQRLAARIPAATPGPLIRIVCQELESWFLGDPAPVAAAYPIAARHQGFAKLEQTDPDAVPNPAALLQELTGTGIKRGRATAIAKHMSPGRNRSKSFQVFVEGVRKLRSP
jgi:hypothetical protein